MIARLAHFIAATCMVAFAFSITNGDPKPWHYWFAAFLVCGAILNLIEASDS